jgi:hypothetical protein
MMHRVSYILGYSVTSTVTRILWRQCAPTIKTSSASSFSPLSSFASPLLASIALTQFLLVSVYHYVSPVILLLSL